MPAELVRAVGRQGTDDEAAVIVELAAAGGVATICDLVLFVRGHVDDGLAAFLVPRAEVGAAPCYAAVDREHGVREAGPVDGYTASLYALRVV